MTSVLFVCSFEIVGFKDSLHELHHAQGFISQNKRDTILCIFSLFCYIIQFRHRSVAQAYLFWPISLNKEISVTATSEAGLILEP